MTDFEHLPVLPHETLEMLNIDPDGIYVDGTVGGGGHSSLIASKLSGKGRLIALDQDEEAIEAAGERLKEFGNKVTIVRSNFRNIKDVLAGLDIYKVNGILLDIGVSSHQLDTAERGFSYMNDGPLDMRMDQRGAISAKDIIRDYSEKDLAKIFRDYGEERYASSIARAIVKERNVKGIDSTGRLTDIIRGAVPGKARHSGTNPAMRTFQALRIEVNGELEALEESLDIMTDLLEEGGRLAVITFHSLEDRIVKEKFRTMENPCICPKNFPVCTCGRKPKGRCVNRKPVTAGEEEQERNKRSHSAKLRVFEKRTATEEG